MIPYISAIDLVAFKIHACNAWGRVGKRHVDAQDARDVLNAIAGPATPVTLNEVQRRVVLEGLDAVGRVFPHNPPG
jgi:hypothetical protein